MFNVSVSGSKTFFQSFEDNQQELAESTFKVHAEQAKNGMLTDSELESRFIATDKVTVQLFQTPF